MTLDLFKNYQAYDTLLRIFTVATATLKNICLDYEQNHSHCY